MQGKRLSFPAAATRPLAQEEQVGLSLVCKEASGREKRNRNPPKVLAEEQKALCPCCIFDDLRSIQHCFIFLWVLEYLYPNFLRLGNL